MSAATAPSRRQTARPAPSPRREQRRRHLRVVEERPVRHTASFVALYIVTGMAIVFAAVSLNAVSAGDAVQARELESQVSLAERQYELLVAEVATLEDPGRIRGIAEGMGMVPAPDPRFLEPGRGLPADGQSTDPEPDGMKPLLTADGQ